MRRQAAFAGLAAAAVALGLAELVAVLTGPRSAPLVAVGGVVVDTVPEPIKQFAIDVFGVYDKVALLTGTVVLLAAVAALAGILALKSQRYAVSLLILLSAAGIAAALTRPGAHLGYALPTLLGAVAGGGVFLVLQGIWPTRPPVSTVQPEVTSTVEPPEMSTVEQATPSTVDAEPVAMPVTPAVRVPVVDEGRRRRWVLGAFVAAIGAGIAGRVLSTYRGVSGARDAVVLPVADSAAPAVPATAEMNINGLARYLTTNRDFYRIDTALVVPQVDPATWRLRIHGRVRNPIELTFAELLDRPMVERHVTLCCVSNEVGGDLIGNALWLGTPVKDLLDEAGPESGADMVLSRSADGWTCGTPTEVLRDGRDALLAVGMNGEPLPVPHGFPVRMVTPGLYGYVSACKWLVELEVTSFAAVDAYWTRRGWSARGPIKTQSRIDVPRDGRTIPSGPTVIAGVAWAQHVGVQGVEVQVDSGEWMPATLADTVSIDTWRQWSVRWDATSGPHAIRVRATDAKGATQTELSRPVLPDGATGRHSIEVTVS